MPYKDPEQQREYQRQWVARNRAQALAGRSCVDCGSTEHLEFDHRNRDEKVDHRIWSWTKARRDAELAKCDVRCADCHRQRHGAGQYKHGSSGYKRGKCRCEVCLAWKAEANARQREARRRRDLHPGTRLCRPLRSSSATAPDDDEAYPEAA